MSFQFTAKEKAIEYLNTQFYMINSLHAADQYLADGEVLLESLKSEIDNNYLDNKENYLEYLTILKRQFYNFFNELSINASTDNNLITYNLDPSKYKSREVKNEWNLIDKIFANHLIPEEQKSIAEINAEFESNDYKFRRLSLPYIHYSEEYWATKIIDIEQISRNNWTEDFIKFHNGELSKEVPHYSKLKHIYGALLSFAVEKHQAEFIWAILGHILTRIKQEEARELSMEGCFEKQEDFNKIIQILKAKTIIHEDTLKWRGVTLNDGRFDKSLGAILALIECLEDKEYLKNKKTTHHMRAFCDTFGCSLKKPTKPTTIHNDFMIVFNSIIPDRPAK